MNYLTLSRLTKPSNFLTQDYKFDSSYPISELLSKHGPDTCLLIMVYDKYAHANGASSLIIRLDNLVEKWSVVLQKLESWKWNLKRDHMVFHPFLVQKNFITFGEEL